MTDALTRLASVCRGIGNPLVASYARCYLSRVSVNLVTLFRSIVRLLLQDCLDLFSSLIIIIRI